MTTYPTGTLLDGKYEVLRALNSGGFGEVVLVRHLHLQERRVVKILRPEKAADPAAAQRFLRTARMATQIKHPNVAILHDYAQLPDSRFYMVWEYVEGEELGQRVERDGPLPTELAVELGIQTLRGLEAIHTAGVIHRDISPDNLLLTLDARDKPRIKIIDLGLAKSLAHSPEESITERGMFMGKLHYCSPEQAGLEEGVELDRRTDLYSFAIVLYESICGKPPFESKSPHGALFMRLNEDPLPLSGRVPGIDVPESLNRAVLRGLARNRDARFPSAVTFIQALERARDELTAATGVAHLPEIHANSPAQPAVAASTAAFPMPETTESSPIHSAGPRPAGTAPSGTDSSAPAQATLDDHALAAEQLLDQHLDHRHLPLARLALENLLDLVPHHPLRRDYKRRVKALADELTKENRVREVLDAGREALARRDLAAAQRKLNAIERSDPTGQISLAFARELAHAERELNDTAHLDELTDRFESLLARGFISEAEARLREIADLKVSKVTLDLFRGRLAEARAKRQTVDVVTRFEEIYHRHLAAGDWAAAREVAFELGRSVPTSERPAEMLAEISEREQRRRHSTAIEQGVQQVEELLDSGQSERATLALSVLKRMAPDHPRCRELEERLRASGG